MPRAFLLLLLTAVLPRAVAPAAELPLETALVEAIAKAEKSVVAVARVRREGTGQRLNVEPRPDPFGRQIKPTDPDFVPNEYAAGVMIDAHGLVLTVYHALGENSDYYVSTNDRKVYRAKIIGADPRSDLAVLAPDDSAVPQLAGIEFPTVSLGNAEGLKKGQWVIALGNPLAIARDGQASASWGIVANLARRAPPVPEEADPTGKTTLHHFGTLIQTDAKLHLGSSGGPLINLRGEMVGLVTAIPSVAGYDEAAGYAIPVDAAFRRIVETLKQGREVEYGFLGLQPMNLTLDEVFRGTHGARVSRVVTGTPAARKGIRVGDIVTAINNVPIFDADGLVLEVGRLPVDAVVRVAVLRAAKVLEFDVELTKYRVRGTKIITTPAAAWRGMRVEYLTAVDETARPGGSVPAGSGVAVIDVEKGSPAWESGLRPGMIVGEVERAAVRTPKEFYAAAGQNGPVRLRAWGADAAEYLVPAP